MDRIPTHALTLTRMVRISARLARELNESGWIDKFKDRSKGSALWSVLLCLRSLTHVAL